MGGGPEVSNHYDQITGLYQEVLDLLILDYEPELG